MQQSDIKQRVASFIAENFLFREDRSSISDTESLIDSGVMDSTGVLELVSFLEGELGLRVDDADIVPENLNSIEAITKYAAAKLGAPSNG